MNKLLITHVDLDGIGSAVLEQYYQDYLGLDNVLCRDYGFYEQKEEQEYLELFSEIVIVDLSMSEEYTKSLRDKGIKVSYYDHHSAADWLEDDEFSNFDITIYGTKNFWLNYVKPRIKRYPVVIDEFVDLVDVYDCWRTENPLWDDAKALNSVFYGMIQYNLPNKELLIKAEPFLNLMKTKFEKLSEWRFTTRETEIIERSLKREDDIYKKAMKDMKFREDSKGRLFGIFYAPSKISLVCHRILLQEPLDYVVCLNSWGGLSGKFSFRTKLEDFDLNTITLAKGHAQACGAQVQPDLAKKFWETPDMVFTYNEVSGESESEYFEFVSQEGKVPNGIS